jgi:hypothetical protein
LAAEYAKCKNRSDDFINPGMICAPITRFGAESSGVWNSSMTENPSPNAMETAEPERRSLSPAARRALAEAQARRLAAKADAKPLPKEIKGPKGPEPTRYGDWENKGIASDF